MTNKKKIIVGVSALAIVGVLFLVRQHNKKKAVEAAKPFAPPAPTPQSLPQMAISAVKSIVAPKGSTLLTNKGILY